MTNRRTKLLTKLAEAEKIRKMAEELGNNDVDPATADQMAEQVFDKLFDEMVNDISLEKLVKP